MEAVSSNHIYSDRGEFDPPWLRVKVNLRRKQPLSELLPRGQLLSMT
jgi:hypothetical protein